MSKKQPSKLDPFAEALLEMDGEGKTLAEMIAWLKEENVTVSTGRLSEFLESLRQSRLETHLFGMIASGGRMNKELDAAYKENPAPDVERLITVTKTLVMSLQVRGAADPKLLSLANSMQQTVLNHLAGVTKAALETRKLALAEQKFLVDSDTYFESLLKKASELNASNLSNADKIAAMRTEAFRAVDELQKSGKVQIPRA